MQTTPKPAKVLRADEKKLEEIEKQIKQGDVFKGNVNMAAYNRKLARANARYALRDKLSKDLKADLKKTYREATGRSSKRHKSSSHTPEK